MASLDKPSLFSSLSLGGRKTPRSSMESQPITHPLLGASSSSLVNDLPDQGEELQDKSPETSTASLPYTPYKPRHRPPQGASTVPASPPIQPAATLTTSPPAPAIVTAAPTTAPTTSMSTSAMFAVPSSEPQLDAAAAATATSRLQLQSLKAAAQRIGLGNGSMGMGMIDAIFDKGARARGEGGDWADLLKVLTSGKAVILLPSSPASSLPMTPQTLRDHIAFLSTPIPSSVGNVPTTPGASTSVLVTLSGLIGTLRSTTVSFESSVPADSPLIAALRDDARRVGVLSRLRPTQPASATFPNYTLSADTAPLPFPALGKAVPVAASDKAVPKEVPRRINPFASFFGSSPSSSTPVAGGSPSKAAGSLSPERPSSPSPVPGSSSVSSPRPSIVSLEIDSDSGEGYSVLAYTINKPVRFNEVHKALVKSVRSGVRADLDGLPERVIEKVFKLVVGAVCPVSGGVVDQALLKSHHHGLGSSEADGSIPLDFSDPSSTGERLQDFMEAIYDDLVAHYRDLGATGAGDKETQVEQAASDGTERVEGLVCRLLYNRIFSPLQSDDARHDEALASRIAALNLLDLSLDHLGLITRPPGEEPKGAVASGLNALVGDIGLELQKLSTLPCLTPKDKADVLVRAHKIAVDGLSRLPAIELRPEGEAYVPPVEDEEASPVDDAEHTPQPFAKHSTSVPEIQLSSGALDEAMADSVHTIVPPTKEHEENKERPLEEATDEFKETPAEVAVEDTDESTAVVTAPKPSTSGADLILPLIIYAVVKANPAQLASQLMYLRRYRSAICLVGEASYAIVNLTAVVEFIEHVHLSELGLGDSSDRVMSVEDLSPIGLTYLDDGNADTASIASASTRLRGRVFQVSEMAGSANKVFTGVVDSSWSALRGFIGTTPQVTATPPDEEPLVGRPITRPRQASTFSLASVTASVANIAAAATTAAARNRSRAGSHGSDMNWSGERELVEVAVSRPSSIRERGIYDEDSASEPGSEDESPDFNVGSIAHDQDEGRPRARSDARSIMSVSSMMSRDRDRERDQSKAEGSLSRDGAGSAGGSKRDPNANSIGNRLAQIGAFGRIGTTPPLDIVTGATTPPDKEKGFFATLTRQPPRRQGTLGLGEKRTDSLKSPTPSVQTLLEEGPMERFMTCEVGDIRMGEVGTLLRDYRRLAGLLAKVQTSPPPGHA